MDLTHCDITMLVKFEAESSQIVIRWLLNADKI